MQFAYLTRLARFQKFLLQIFSSDVFVQIKKYALAVIKSNVIFCCRNVWKEDEVRVKYFYNIIPLTQFSWA